MYAPPLHYAHPFALPLQQLFTAKPTHTYVYQCVTAYTPTVRGLRYMTTAI